MATNFFFNNFKSSQEQLLIENLIIEAIRIYGEDMYYIPRKINNYDSVYGADDQSSYELAIPLELYIKSVDGFAGDGNFMSKFGIEIRDQVTFSVAQRRFYEDVSILTAQPRPFEGDLIFFPLNQKCFQIKSVSKFEMFYQMGGLQTWELTCELFEYSNERFSTGIPEIDSIQKSFDTNQLDWGIMLEDGISYLLDEDGSYIVLEGADLKRLVPGSDNEEIQKESDQFIDFTAFDPFAERNI
jgi:hypothetical protein